MFALPLRLPLFLVRCLVAGVARYLRLPLFAFTSVVASDHGVPHRGISSALPEGAALAEVGLQKSCGAWVSGLIALSSAMLRSPPFPVAALIVILSCLLFRYGLPVFFSITKFGVIIPCELLRSP